MPFLYIHHLFHPLTSTLSLLTESLLVELPQFFSRGLAKQIYKANNSVRFRDFLVR